MQKQMKSLFTTMLAIGLFCQSQAADLFTPVQKTELRAPSVPLITSDPYLSIWSPYDKLKEVPNTGPEPNIRLSELSV